MTANALQGMQVSIVSILGLLVVRYSAFMRLNAWLYLKYIMLAIALLIGKESADCSLPTLSQTAGAVVGGAIYAKKLFKKKSNTAPRFQQLSSVQTQDILDGDENE
ncbi:hypothetical protein CUMW_134430 [Citrus unshiu]|nr:hypothetical protein CUMW_134430 [Citrus unshiu]